MKMPYSKIAGHFLLVLILDFGKALVTVKSSAPSPKNQTLQEITIPAGSFVFEFEIFVYIPDHIRYQLSSAQGNNIVPAGFENSSVRYFSASSPFACAVEIREYSAALALAPLAVQ